MAQQIVLTNTVKDSQLGQRLDQAIAELFADFSRSRLKEWLLDGKVQVNGEVVTKPRTKVMGGEEITLQAELEDEERWEAQDIPLDIVYEDDDIIVINKPRGLRRSSWCWYTRWYRAECIATSLPRHRRSTACGHRTSS